MVAYVKKEAESRPKVTAREYLERERQAETKSEYYGGEIVAMAGASKEHNRLTVNLTRHISNQLEGTPCELFANDMRVGVPECDRYYYPNVVVVCGEPQFEDQGLDTLLNPKVVIEVLSDSTEAIDLGEKFLCYRGLPSVTDYVLVSQNAPLVEHYARQSHDRWLLTVATGLDARLVLASIGCTVDLTDLYDRVPFPTGPPKEEAESHPVTP